MMTVEIDFNCGLFLCSVKQPRSCWGMFTYSVRMYDETEFWAMLISTCFLNHMNVGLFIFRLFTDDSNFEVNHTYLFSGGFKGQNKLKIARRQAEEEDIKDQEEPELPSQTTMEFGLRTYRFIRIVSLFCHGLTAGFAVWHIVMAYVLSAFGNDDFLQHYGVLGLPVQSIFYVLLVICTVSACDRWEYKCQHAMTCL